MRKISFVICCICLIISVIFLLNGKTDLYQSAMIAAIWVLLIYMNMGREDDKD